MTFVELFRLMRSHLGRLLLATLLGGALGYGYASTLPPVFAADSSGQIVVAAPQSDIGSILANSSVAASKVSAFLPYAQTRAVAQRAIEETGINATPAQIVGRISATIPDGTSMIRVSATAPTAEEARLLADAMVRAVAAEANRIELGGTVKPGQQAVVRVVPIEMALPGAQIGPNVQKYVLAGLAGGFGLMAGWILLRRALDTRIRTVKQVEENTGTSVLAVVPQTAELRASKGRGRLGSLGMASESFRQLRTNLRFVNVDNPPRSMVVTSANSGEGKSTISATLARVLAESGRPVVLIDADLRRPMLATIFERRGSVGLTQVLSGQLELEAALQPTEQPNLLLITAGRIPPNPSELLGSHRMNEVITELSRNNFVILDAPPLLSVTDAGLLTAMCDGALFVFAVGKTHRDQAAQCAKSMAHVGGKVLGTVLNLAPKRKVYGVVYGYGYGYGSYQNRYYYTSKGDGTGARRAKRRRGKDAETSPETQVEVQA